MRIKRDAGRVIRALNNRGIEAKRPVFKPLHRYLGLDKKRFPHTEAVFNSAISLPVYPTLKKSEAKFIVETFHKIIE